MKSKQQIEDRIKDYKRIAEDFWGLKTWEEADQREYEIAKACAYVLEWVLKDE